MDGNENPLDIKFIFNENEIKIKIQPKDWLSFSQDFLFSLKQSGKYEVRANISEEVFRSFINYFNNGEVPDIHYINIEEYLQLNHDFQITSISESIKLKKDFFTKFLNNIHKLNNSTITDKSDIEKKISQQLDYYITEFGSEIIKLPIQSLCNILTNPSLNFTLHNDFYELILSNFKQTSDSNIFILLQFLDGKLISHQNFIDSIQNQTQHLGFIPKYDVSTLIQNVQQILTKEKEESKNDEDFHYSTKFIQNKIFYKLDQKHLKAKIYLSNSRASHFIIPKTITYQDKKYSIIEIGHTETNYSINSITFSENCEIKTIDLNEINCYRLKQFNIPPSVEKVRINNSSFLSNITISKKKKIIILNGQMMVYF